MWCSTHEKKIYIFFLKNSKTFKVHFEIDGSMQRRGVEPTGLLWLLVTDYTRPGHSTSPCSAWGSAPLSSHWAGMEREERRWQKSEPERWVAGETCCSLTRAQPLCIVGEMSAVWRGARRRHVCSLHSHTNWYYHSHYTLLAKESNMKALTKLQN